MPCEKQLRRGGNWRAISSSAEAQKTCASLLLINGNQKQSVSGWLGIGTKETSLAQVPVTLKSEVSKETRILKRWKTAEYSITFNLLLLPKNAGQITVTEKIKTDPVPSGTPQTKTLSETRSNCKPDAPCETNAIIRIADNFKITNVRYDCIGDKGVGFATVCGSVNSRRLYQRYKKLVAVRRRLQTK